LYAATPAYKATLAARMLFADLGTLGIPIKLSAPTPLYTDESVVIDGLETGRLTKQTRWVVTRFGMLSNGRDADIIDPRKIKGELNCFGYTHQATSGTTIRSAPSCNPRAGRHERPNP
jgi:hypothetical protein